MTAENSINISA